METPTRAFLQTAPSLKRIADETGIDYGYLRQIAAGKQDAGLNVRRKLVEWGQTHAAEYRAALRALRKTLPDH